MTALRNRRLLFWLAPTALCDLLDEILVVFAALYLRDHLHAGRSSAAWSHLVKGFGAI